MCLIINITRGVVWVELLIIDAAPGRACDGARKATSFYTAFYGILYVPFHFLTFPSPPVYYVAAA